MEEIEELNGSRKKKVIVSLATLGAIAASGEGVRRRRRQAPGSRDRGPRAARRSGIPRGGHFVAIRYVSACRFLRRCGA